MVGEVALVFGGGEGLGRAAALALAARGVRVVVSGADERSIARVVGEVTCGGGTARHLAGDAGAPDRVEAAVEKALGAFGKLTYVLVAGSSAAVAHAVAVVVAPRLGDGGRLIVIGDGGEDGARASVASVVSGLDPSVEASGATINGLVWTDRGEGDVEAGAEVVVFLCSDAADGISRETLEVKGRAPR
jgi:NAD(P)-dependent dehydrogenase (short-subunit alcohol dehydrogenase family)